LANGGNFEALIKKKITFTTDEAMLYFTMILISLHYLHSKGITHRDLKPANILIDKIDENKDETIILKIGDFGISKFDLKDMKRTLTKT